MQGGFLNSDNLKNFVSQMNMGDPMRSLAAFTQPNTGNPPFPGADEQQLAYNKFFQDILKNPSLLMGNSDKGGMMNFYPQNFNK